MFGDKPGNEFAFISRGAEAWFNFGRQVTMWIQFLQPKGHRTDCILGAIVTEFQRSR